MLVFWDIHNSVRELTFRGCSCGAKSLSLLRQLSMRVNRPVFPVAWARAYTTSYEKEGNKRCNSRKSPAWLSINSVNEYCAIQQKASFTFFFSTTIHSRIFFRSFTIIQKEAVTAHGCFFSELFRPSCVQQIQKLLCCVRRVVLLNYNLPPLPHIFRF